MRINFPETSQPAARENLLKIWAQFQHELLYLCWAVMDVALLTPFALTLMDWARLWPAALFFLWLLLIMLLAFNLARVMGALYVPVQYQQVVMAVGLALLIFLSLRTLVHEPQSLWDISWLGLFFQRINEKGNLLWLRDVVIFFLVVLMWVRGIQLATREITISRIGLRLRVGSLIIAPIVLWVSGFNIYVQGTAFILLFLLAGITAVALTRAEEIAQDESGHSASLTPRWLLLIILAGLLIVFVAGIIAVLASGESSARVVGLLSPLWLALGATVIAATGAISYVLQPIVVVISWLLEYLFAIGWLSAIILHIQQVASQLRPFEGLFPDQETPEVAVGTDWTVSLKIIVVLVAAAIVLTTALGLYENFWPTKVKGRRTIFKQRIGGPSIANGGLLQKTLGRIGVWRQWRTAVSIRRIYKQMMELAEINGYPKLDTETPYEYLPTLDQAWPQNRPDTHLITNAYVKVRYGEIPETQAELDDIRQAWQRLHQTPPAESMAESA